MVDLSGSRLVWVAALLVFVCGFAVLAVLLLVGGDVRADWDGAGRESHESRCSSTVRECGTFCIYPKCTWCSDCSCVCCSSTRTNTGCYCSSPCPCWPDPNQPGQFICQQPTLHVHSDCGDTCVDWEYLLYQGSNQPGRSDGVVSNPFYTDGLGTALYVVGQPFEGTECVEEQVPGEETMQLVGGFTPWSTIVVQTGSGSEERDVPVGVTERIGDVDLGLPVEVSFVEAGFEAWDDPVVLSGVAERAGALGSFDFSISGVPSGSLPLFRHWEAGYGSVPLASLVPFGLVPSPVVLPRGWHALQAAYTDGEGNPVGWSRVTVVHSRGAWDALDPSELGLKQPPAEPTPVVPEGVDPPPAISLGDGVVVAGSGLVTFPVGGVPADSELEYRVWSWTGSFPDPDHVAWQLGYPVGGTLSVSHAGPDGDLGGYVAVQVRVRRWAGVEHGYVHGPGSPVRHFWVEPRHGGWVPVAGRIGEYQWVDGGRSPFVEPAATPVPQPEDGLGLPSQPVIVSAVRRDATPGRVELTLGGLDPAPVWLEYRLWPATGFPPVGELAEWILAVLQGGVLVLDLGGAGTGGYGQWMAIQLRQVRLDAEEGVVGGVGSEVLELQVPAVLRRPLGES